MRQHNQAWKDVSQSQSNAYRPPQGYKPPHHNTAAVPSLSSITDPGSFYLWHSHLEHVLSSCLRFLASTGALRNLKTCDISDCSGCKLTNFPLYLLIEVFLFLLHHLT